MFSLFPAYFKKYKIEFIIFFSVFIVYSFFTILKIANNLPIEGLSADYYLQIAENLSKSFLFSLDGINPTALRMPGYPLFLAVIFSIFKNWWAALFIQHIIAGASAVILYLISKEWLNRFWAIAVSLIWAFEPYAIDISSQFFTEPIYILLILAAVFIFIKYKGKNRKYFIPLMALMFAILMYIRPTSLFLPMIFAIAIIYDNNKTKKTLFQLSAMFLIYIALLFPWSLRNHLSFGSWQLSSDNASSIYITASQFKASQKGFENSPAEVPKESGLPKFKESGQLSQTSEAIIKSANIILSDPLNFTAFYFKHLIIDSSSSSWWGSLGNLIKATSGQTNYHEKVKNAVLNFEIKDIVQFSPKEIAAAIIMVSGTIFWVSIFLFSILGVYALFKKSDTNTKPPIILISGIIIYLISIENMAGGDMIRYRFQASPFIIMFAVSGIFFCLKNKK